MLPIPEHAERPVLAPNFLLLLPDGLMQGLQPHVPEGDQGVGVVGGGGVVDDPLELLLARAPLLLGQVEVPHEGPRVRVVVVHTQRLAIPEGEGEEAYC